MERCRACGAPVEHSAPDGDLKYYPAAASRSGPRHERERIIAALRAGRSDLVDLVAGRGMRYWGPDAALYAIADWLEREFADKAT